jgi:hypothetical protein
MKLTATGGTDGANIVLYWPDHLPDDADARLKADPVELLDQLERDGKLVQFPCDSDGAYSLTVFVGEAPPADLMRYCKEAKRYERLAVTGDGYFGGAEYVCKRDCAFREKYPHMSTKVSIPAATYAATVYEVELPDELEAQWIRDHAGAAAVRMSNAMGLLAGGVVLCVIAALVGLKVMSWTVWACVAAAGLALAAAAWAVSRMPGYRAVAEAQRAFERTYPAYVVQLSQHGPPRRISDMKER